MDGRVISATALARAAVDPDWRGAWLRGEAPPVWQFPPNGTRRTFGGVFHQLAHQFVVWLTGAENRTRAATLASGQQLWDALYQQLARERLLALLQEHPAAVAEVHQLGESLKAFCHHLAAQRRGVVAFREWRDLFLLAEHAPDPVVHRTSAGAIGVSGRVDAVRTDPQHAHVVVDYKLNPGQRLEQDLVQLAIYAWLLRQQYPEARFTGAIEYYTPDLTVTPVTPEQLAAVFQARVHPALDALAAGVGLPREQPPATVPAPAPAPATPPAEPADDPAERDQSREIEAAFAQFNLSVGVVRRIDAPQVVRYHLEPGNGVKTVSLANRAEDVQIRLKVAQPPHIVTGPGHVILDVARATPRPVAWRDWIGQPPLAGAPGLIIPLGVGVEGTLHCADLADPNACHLLVAGTTGSGKSVFLQALAATLMARNTPHTLRLTVIDPKILTFGALRDSPYLEGALVSDLAGAVARLEEAVEEMERRYHALHHQGLESLHQWHRRGACPHPFQVILFDEFADLVLAGGKEKVRFENLVSRLAGKARAAGIHLVLATQRPDAKVVTGTIKANLPLKVCLKVANGINSNIILDQTGGERLVGKGDLLYTIGALPERAQSLFITQDELGRAGKRTDSGKITKNPVKALS